MQMNHDMLALMRETAALLQKGGAAAATENLQQRLAAMMPAAVGAAGAAAGAAGSAAGPRAWAGYGAAPMRDINSVPDHSASGHSVSGHSAPVDPAARAGMHGDFVPDLLASLGIAMPDVAGFGAAPDVDAQSLMQRLRRAPRQHEQAADAEQAKAEQADAEQADAEQADAVQDRAVQDKAGQHGAKGERASSAQPSAAGQFLTASFGNEAGTRAYKLYVPSAYNGQALPLVVMLHGCKQHPDDFAAGTRFNDIAEQTPCLVLYPAQAQSANVSGCWNWFSADDQQRGGGEPAILAGMTQQVIARYHVDPARVYVAGLSAGAAMAIIMGSAYPELYAAIGIHSGLPVGAAHDLPSALAAMKRGAATGTPRRVTQPIIVFHGERDPTVHPRNADQVIAQGIAHNGAATNVTKGRAAGGHAYTRTVHQDADGNVVAERWLVHGAGHAWSGGSSSGSYTDRKGPDASEHMMRFFAAAAKPPR